MKRLIGTLAAGLALVTAAGAAMADDTQPPEEGSPGGEVEATETPDTDEGSDDADGDDAAKPDEAKPDPKPAETKPAGAKPADARSAEAPRPAPRPDDARPGSPDAARVSPDDAARPGQPDPSAPPVTSYSGVPQVVAPAPEGGLQFGSYGRVSVGSDLRGGTGRQARIVSRPPRLLEGSYTELDFNYDHVLPDGATFTTRTTLALGNDLFHFDSQFDAQVALRNLYAEARDVGFEGFSAWIGSRMYRGDDVYLLDFWPLDEQNTVGGGVGYHWGDGGGVKAHIGLHRLDDEFQLQTIQVPADDFGARDVLFLDRQRVVTTLRGEQHFGPQDGTRMKLVLYGELHALAEGTRLDVDDEPEQLPGDSGVMGGFELGFYQPGTANYANLFVRYGAGLAAFDELAIPGDLSANDTAEGAGELMLALSANWQNDDVGLLAGAYARYFEDADGVTFDRDDVWEVGAAVRPAWFITDAFHLLGEVNAQYLRPNGVFQETGLQEVPLVWEFALMPTLSYGKGSYARPQLRLVYAATILNDSALLTYAPDDPLRDRGVRHFLGFSAEWWFFSSRG